MALKPIPETYLQPIANGGTVVRVDYTTKTYDEENREVPKFCYVYLPYGYDESKKYNTLYCLHGLGGEIEVFLGNGANETPTDIKLTLDNMIANGDIEPTIVVSPTYYCGPIQNDRFKAADLVDHFKYELANDLIPAVESKFSTWAETTDLAGLKASRDHRAYTGFSLGSLSTWYTFINSCEYIRYFMPMSGDCWAWDAEGKSSPPAAAQRIAASIEAHGLPFRVYAVTGDKDVAYRSMSALVAELDASVPACKLISDENPNGSLSYEVEPDAIHDYKYMPLYFYNGLPTFWKA